MDWWFEALNSEHFNIFGVAAEAYKELFRLPKSGRTLNINSQCPNRAEQIQVLVLLRRRKCRKSYHLRSERSREHFRYVAMPWFQDDLRIVRPEFRGRKGWMIAPADLPYVLPMLVLVAEQPLAPGDEDQQAVAAQKEGFSEPSTLWADPMLGRWRGGTGRVEPPRPLQEANNQVVPAHWLAIYRSLWGCYSCYIYLEHGRGATLFQQLLQERQYQRYVI